MAIGDSMDDIFNDIFGGELASKLDLSLFFSFIVIIKNSNIYYNFSIFGYSISYVFFSSFNVLPMTYFYFYLFIFSIVTNHPLLDNTTSEPIEGESTSK